MLLTKQLNRYLHYGIFFRYPRKVFKYLMVAIYPIVIRVWKLPSIKSIEETILKIKNEKCSIARFGDGEVLYIVDKLNLPFQDYDSKLAEKLIEILKIEYPKLIVGLPEGYRSINDFENEIQLFWKSQISFAYPRFRKYLKRERQYWNANITRLYYGYKDKTHSGKYFELMRSIWDNRDILIIEGEKSRLGIGNNLFTNANKIERILGPAQNAFSKFDALFKEALRHNKDKLILIALGPTAKALSYELSKHGYQVIDIGNFDIEYEWYRLKAKERVIIEGKYTSEVKGGRDVADITDRSYTEQIIKKVI